ncbi:MAG: tRNA (5-methylaminomethyl-2-thiouridine)(34)-methyltransferase MnmD [Draconibacterium sp.]|nr:tRNA (5-methylaminomethyl-2-thiouridine)(34)-methyltransferase MnmD [Draconibacterium sp.]
MDLQIIKTADGSPTLFVPELEEQYHSINGAITESEYVFLEKGYNFHLSRSPVVFEVGFGTGLNCLLTALSAIQNKRFTKFYSIEKYPVPEKIIFELDYGKYVSEFARSIFNQIISCSWNKAVEINPYFELVKIKADLTNFDYSIIQTPDIIFFDSFGPDKQPGMWTKEIFTKIYNACKTNSVFVTYSAKGEVRRNLTSVGFVVERLPGPPGKKQMLRGIKNPPNL